MKIISKLLTCWLSVRGARDPFHFHYSGIFLLINHSGQKILLRYFHRINAKLLMNPPGFFLKVNKLSFRVGDCGQLITEIILNYYSIFGFDEVGKDFIYELRSLGIRQNLFRLVYPKIASGLHNLS